MKVPIVEGTPGRDISSNDNEVKQDLPTSSLREVPIVEGISGGVNPSEERGVEEEDDSSLATFKVCNCTNGHQEDIVSTSWPRGVQDTG